MQVAGVKKPLASVRKMCDAGNRVVFENDEQGFGGYVQNRETGATVPINKTGGTYQVSLWTLADQGASYLAALPDGEDSEAEPEVEGANSSSSTGFPRRA